MGLNTKDVQSINESAIIQAQLHLIPMGYFILGSCWNKISTLHTPLKSWFLIDNAHGSCILQDQINNTILSILYPRDFHVLLTKKGNKDD